MSDDFDLFDIDPRPSAPPPTAAQVQSGIPIPAVRLIQVFSPDEWEEFTEEWLSYQKAVGSYHSVRRFSGPGDRGLDVVAFTTADGFKAPWDSYQCKHYGQPLSPEDVRIEVAKLVFHSFKKSPPYNQACPLPQRHIFVSPRGCGITVARWFKDAARFKKEVREYWLKNGLPNIGKGIDQKFAGLFLTYFDSFDFSIFGDKSAVELIGEHEKTIFHAARFGGGLPARGRVPAPPAMPGAAESIYLKKLFAVYGENTGKTVGERSHLEDHTNLLDHFDRQRVLFYNAEALRNFARDRTPFGAFDSLKDDVFNGVIDASEGTHSSGLDRLRTTLTTAGAVDISGNALVTVTRVADKQGVCHHLANEERLTWVQDDD